MSLWKWLSNLESLTYDIPAFNLNYSNQKRVLRTASSLAKNVEERRNKPNIYQQGNSCSSNIGCTFEGNIDSINLFICMDDYSLKFQNTFCYYFTHPS